MKTRVFLLVWISFFLLSMGAKAQCVNELDDWQIGIIHPTSTDVGTIFIYGLPDPCALDLDGDGAVDTIVSNTSSFSLQPITTTGVYTLRGVSDTSCHYITDSITAVLTDCTNELDTSMITVVPATFGNDDAQLIVEPPSLPFWLEYYPVGSSRVSLYITSSPYVIDSLAPSNPGLSSFRIRGATEPACSTNVGYIGLNSVLNVDIPEGVGCEFTPFLYRLTNESFIGSCDGMVSLTDDLFSNYGLVEWSKIESGSTISIASNVTTLNGLCSGNYQVIASNLDTTCRDTLFFTIDSFGRCSDYSANFLYQMGASPINCDGYAEINIPFGSHIVTPFTDIIYSPRVNLTYPSREANTRVEIWNLCPGTYSAIVEDSVTLCRDTVEFSIDTASCYNALDTTMVTVVPASSGDNNGQLILHPPSLPFFITHSQSLVFPFTEEVASIPYVVDSLPAGDLYLFGSVDSGCWINDSLMINIPTDSGCLAFNPTVSPTHETASGACDGSALLSGNLSDYQAIQWFEVGGSVIDNNVLSVDSLCPGNYAVYVQDSSLACSDTLYSTIDSASSCAGFSYAVDVFWGVSSPITCMGGGVSVDMMDHSYIIPISTFSSISYGSYAPWAPWDRTAAMRGFCPGTHSIIVADSLTLCRDTLSFDIDTASCYNELDTSMISIVPATLGQDNGQIIIDLPTTPMTIGWKVFSSFFSYTSYSDLAVSTPYIIDSLPASVSASSGVDLFGTSDTNCTTPSLFNDSIFIQIPTDSNCAAFNPSISSIQDETLAGACDGQVTVDMPAGAQIIAPQFSTTGVVDSLCSGLQNILVELPAFGCVDTLNAFIGSGVSCDSFLVELSYDSLTSTTGFASLNITPGWDSIVWYRSGIFGSLTPIDTNVTSISTIVSTFFPRSYRVEVSFGACDTIIEFGDDEFTHSVSNPCAGYTASVDSIVHASSFSACDGQVWIDLPNATSSVVSPSFSATGFLSGLCPGRYDVVIEDSLNGCEDSVVVTINSLGLSPCEAFYTNLLNSEAETAAGACDGSVQIAHPASAVLSGLPSSASMVTDSASSCRYTLVMYDSFGDGWNGGELSVESGGSLIGRYSAFGSGSNAAFSVPAGNVFSLTYASGSWESENTYFLYDSDGNLVFSDGPNPSVGTETFFSSCPNNVETTISGLCADSYTVVIEDTALSCADTLDFTIHTETAPCIDSTLICDACLVPDFDYPVCGCDGVTYDNPAHASYSGVTSYSVGPCASAALNHICGYFYEDANNNCVMDAGEAGYTHPSGGFVLVELYQGSTLVSSDYHSPSTGFYQFWVPDGTYDVVVSSVSDLACPASGVQTVTVAGGGGLCDVNFGVQSSPSAFDLSSYLYFSSTATPGFPRYGYIRIDQDYDYASGITVEYHHDPLYDLVSTTPMYDSYDPVNHVLTWNIGTMSLHSYEYFNLNFDVPVGATLGQPTYDSVIVKPLAGDINVLNNPYVVNDSVVGSWDPNDKMVAPAGIGPQGAITLDEKDFSYMIRFQNLGNAPARFVEIRDTLDVDLDLSTIKVKESSHNFEYYVEDNILYFLFPNINLPDSASDPAGSIGFVSFDISAKDDAVYEGNQVMNSAAIYFDYNAPVITNTTVNTWAKLTTSVVSQDDEILSLTAYPNPTYGAITIEMESDVWDSGYWVVTDMLGRVVQRLPVDVRMGANQYRLDLGQVASGSYHIGLEIQGRVKASMQVIKQ